MIAYDILCENTHKFEGWFKSREDVLLQKEKGILECPFCGSKKLEQMSAPKVRTSKNSRHKDTHEKLRELATTVTDYMNKNFEDVGSDFAEEARKIYYREAEVRNIKGIATKEETDSLREEGINCITLPKQKLHS